MSRLLLGACVFLSACATAAPPVATQAIELSADQVAAVQAGLRASLKDPDSARFGPMKASRAGDAIYVCGYVNAKNSYGGFTGMQSYFGLLAEIPAKEKDVRSFSPIGFGSTDIDVKVVGAECQRHGLRLPTF